MKIKIKYLPRGESVVVPKSIKSHCTYSTTNNLGQNLGFEKNFKNPKQNLTISA